MDEFQAKYGVPYTKMNCQFFTLARIESNCSILAYSRVEPGNSIICDRAKIIHMEATKLCLQILPSALARPTT